MKNWELQHEGREYQLETNKGREKVGHEKLCQKNIKCPKQQDQNYSLLNGIELYSLKVLANKTYTHKTLKLYTDIRDSTSLHTQRCIQTLGHNYKPHS